MSAAKITAYGNYDYLSTGPVPLPENAYYDSRSDFIERGAEHLKDVIKDAVLIKPLHVYNHSGISFSTDYSGQYADRWDSGTCGFIYVTKEGLRKHFGVKRLSKKHLEEADKIIEEKVAYLNEDGYL